MGWILVGVLGVGLSFLRDDETEPSFITFMSQKRLTQFKLSTYVGIHTFRSTVKKKSELASSEKAGGVALEEKMGEDDGK